MSLKQQLADDLKDAIRGKDEPRKSAIRMVIWSVKNAEVAAGKPLEDPDVLAAIAKQVKQRRESIEEFQKGSRQDLVDKEAAEMRVLEKYLPPAMSREEITEVAREVIAEVGARAPSDKGKVMRVLVARLAGRADGRAINEIVTELLASAPA